ncbi:MAG TPA: sulfite exporter TauE/SafE family protein [Candidatus Angelobacter sp.]|jgi:uncharacterized membrane protein YfcA|nr:sulfite exporter TauE/SafE family protein [Candidatus Angelobacter sp.]
MAIKIVQITPPRPLMKFWYLYVSAFLAAWIVLMLIYGLFPEVLHQWPIALVMIMGSLVAGSTPMGGGAVSFPFLVLWLGVSPESARNFGLVIQALGMTSAMIFILCRRVPVQSRALVWTIVAAAGGMFLGTFAVAPHVAGNFVKLIFACMWMSFAILTIWKNREFCSITGSRSMTNRAAMQMGILVGLTGGIIASIIGVGVEMILYIALVLLYRCDLKVAVPTAVSAMAVTSVVGVAARLCAGEISRDVVMKFLAAGPLVIFGAPIGTYIVSVIPRIRTLYVISILCIAQFVWTLSRLQRTPEEWAFVVAAITLASAVFYWMYRRGKRCLSVHQEE